VSYFTSDLRKKGATMGYMLTGGILVFVGVMLGAAVVNVANKKEL
jgi:hypothetical protein